MIHCKALNKDFSTKEEMFSALRVSAKDIIGVKKAEILKSCEKGISVKAKCLDISKIEGVDKASFSDDNYYYIAVNTVNILDSHNDLHVKGIWNKSAKERTFKNYLVDTHVMSMGTTLAKKEDVEIFVAEIPFASIGKSFKGNVEALIYKILKTKLRKDAAEWLDDGYAIEASVKMQYVNILFAMDSDAKEDVTFKKNFDDYIGSIANKEEYEEEYVDITHFWIVKEAKNVGESSFVLQASNSSTGIINTEPLKSTQTKEDEAVKTDTSVSSNFNLI